MAAATQTHKRQRKHNITRNIIRNTYRGKTYLKDRKYIFKLHKSYKLKMAWWTRSCNK